MFLHPVIFWTGLAAVAVPILIHLLNRRRFRIRPWAAMKFLMESLRRNRRRLRIEDIILLALRCLVVLLLALGAARFVGCAAMNLLPLGHGGSQSVVFVLDDSLSMGQRFGNGTIFQAAAHDLAGQLRTLPKSDKVAIVLTSRPDAGEPFFKPTYAANIDMDSLTSRIETLKPSDRRTGLAEALAAAGKLLEGESGPKRLCLMSDFRKIDLASPEQAQAVRKEFAALKDQKVEVAAWDYGREGKTNLTVQGIDLLDRFAVAKAPLRVAVSVRNNGASRAENVEVKLTAALPVRNGKAGEVREVELPSRTIESIEPGDAKRVEFTVTCPQAGFAVVRAEIPSDELPGDNVASKAVEVKEAMRVLVVDGRPDVGDPAESESFFLVHALDPSRDGAYGCRVEIVSADGLAAVNFEDYDAVILLDVASFPVQAVAASSPAGPGDAVASPATAAASLEYPQLAALEKYVAGGGGLAIFTGEHPNLSFYNGAFYADGGGLSPFRIGPPAGDTSAQDKYFRLDPKTIAAGGLLQCFTGEGAAMVSLIRFYACTPCDERAAAGAEGLGAAGAATGEPLARGQVKPPRVLGRFTNPASSPAVVERQFGDGTVIVFYTTASTRWNDWPIDEMGTYVAVMNDLLAQVVRGGQRHSGRVGEALEYELDEGLVDAVVTLKRPSFPATDIVSLPVNRTGGKGNVRYEQTDEAGVYAIGLGLPEGAQRQILFSRQIDPDEGDLRAGHQTDIAAAFGSEDFGYFAALEATGGGGAAGAREYWKYAIVAMIVLLGLEVFLGQRFGHYS